MKPAYGAFYSAWSLYLRSVVLRASGTTAQPPPFDLKAYEADCRRFAAALAENQSPFLPSYPGSAWPADTAVGVAALANGDTELATALLATVEALGFPIDIAGQRRYADRLVPVGDAFLAWARSAPVKRGSFHYVPILPRWWRLPLHGLSLILAAVVCYVAGWVIRNGRTV